MWLKKKNKNKTKIVGVSSWGKFWTKTQRDLETWLPLLQSLEENQGFQEQN